MHKGVAPDASPGFLGGVIEGFYGKPWSQADRFELFTWMTAWGLNTYLYAPKDDLKHRVLWREPCSEGEARILAELITACAEGGVQFVYALSPGLDLRYSDPADQKRLRRRFEQLLSIGAQHFALFFDDIPDRLDKADLDQWGSLASAQAHVANTLFQWVRQRVQHARFLFCPTAYCGRMAACNHGGVGYLQTLGRELLPPIDVLWTGPEIVSREITVQHVMEIGKVLRRKPVIWDNLHANDYDGRRFFCGPYAGRPLELRHAVNGILSNPNCEFLLNHVPLRTLAQYLREQVSWDPRAAWLKAVREWLPQFATVGRPVTLEDLVLLCDCYYLPHEEGPEAECLYQRIAALLQPKADRMTSPALDLDPTALRLAGLCGQLTELRDRPLFHALCRRLWDLREELDLLRRYVVWQSRNNSSDNPCRSDFHLPGTCRGGLVARLQRLLTQQPDGSFILADHPNAARAAPPPVTRPADPENR